MKRLIVFSLIFISWKVHSQQVVGNWPGNPNDYTYFGTDGMSQEDQKNYSLLQKKTSGITYLNSPSYINFRIENQDKMILTHDGKFGIGTTSPMAKLDIKGSSQNEVIINAESGSPDMSFSQNDDAKAQLLYDVNNSGLLFRVSASHTGINGWSGTDRFFINGNNGNVGIGTIDTDDAKLTVDGKVTAEEVKVKDIQGADFVFEEDYQLPKLNEIAKFIQQNQHLPQIPSAKEMQQNGLELGKFNILLLQKIEELTLYLIEQNKTILAQQESISQLQKEVDHLESNK